MKNIKLKWAVLLSLPFLLTQCTNNTSEEFTEVAVKGSFEEQILAIPNNEFEGPELITLYSEVMKEVLVMAQDEEFRSFAYNQSLKQASGDYDFLIEDMAKGFLSNEKFGKSASKITGLCAKIEGMNGGIRPIVFFPKAETIEDAVKTNKNFNVARNLNEPVAVLKGAYNDDYSAPGYTLDSNGELLYNRDVTEEDAWTNDVYVIGEEEVIANLTGQPIIAICDDPFGEGNCVGDDGGTGGGTGGSGGGSSNLRTEGRAEYGGDIQVTDLNEIEHWFSGKLEFRIIVAGLSGSAGTVILNRQFGKVRRRNFKNEKWFNYNAFIANWNTSVLGQWNVENWMELDGGSSASVSIALPKATPESPTVTVTLPSESLDDNLGMSIVQFPDRLTQVYGISFMNFRRN